MTETGSISSGALEDIAYLSRSENRVRILHALTTNAYPRRELEEVTETSRTTLGRILSELEERGWAERTVDGTYVATPRGEHLIAEFTPLVRSMETIRALGDAVAQIPTDELSIGLHHFSDATVIRTAPNEPLEPARPLAHLLRDATTFETLTFLAPPLAVGNAMYDGVQDGRLTVKHVFAGGLVEYLRDQPDGPPPWHDYLQSGAEIYRYDGHIPCNLFIVDDRILLLNDRPDGKTFVESENETVHEWAKELIETYRNDAERVDAEMFAQNSS